MSIEVEGIFGLVLEEILVHRCADHALQHQIVKLSKKTYNTTLRILSPPFPQNFFTLKSQLCTRHWFYFRSRTLFQCIESVLQNFLPIFKVHHLWQTVFKCVWTFRQRIQNDVAGESYADFLENYGSFGDHEDWLLAHFINRPLPLAFFSLCVLTDHGDLSIFSLKVCL